MNGKIMKNDARQTSQTLHKLAQIVCISLFPIVSYFWLGPLEIFSANQKDFQFFFGDFFPLFVIASIVILIIMIVVLFFLPVKISHSLISLIFGFSLASYLQNMFLNKKLSEATGQRMNWDSLGSIKHISNILFFLIIIVSVALGTLLKDVWQKTTLFLSAFFVTIQLVAVVSLLFTGIEYEKPDSEVFSFANDHYKMADENVILFVMDTVGNVEFDEALERHPEFKNTIKDFTYFNNADCHYFTTFPSLTHMLTGYDMNFEMVAQDWLGEAWKNKNAENFYRELKELGYDRRLYIRPGEYEFGYAENIVGKFDNVHATERNVSTKTLFKKMLKYSIYKYVPYMIKPYFEMITADFDVVETLYGPTIQFGNGINYDFYEELCNTRLSHDDSTKKAFIVEYILGIHPGFETNLNAPDDGEATVEEGMDAMLVIMEEYVSQLKDIGVYDNSTIIFCGDHGSWDDGKDPQPMFLLKEKNDSNFTMEYNHSPVSYDELLATLKALVGIENTNGEKTFFDWKESDIRTREVYMRGNDPNYPPVKNSGFNIYYRCEYTKDKEEVSEQMANKEYEIVTANEWK